MRLISEPVLCSEPMNRGILWPIKPGKTFRIGEIQGKIHFEGLPIMPSRSMK